MKQSSQLIFERNTVEFVTVAAEFCLFVEQCEQRSRRDFVNTALKILPLLYIKASMLTPHELLGEDTPEQFVTEGDYELVRVSLSELMGNADDYLDVFVQDMVYSDTPIRRTISEDMADIYQDIKNFVMLFRLGVNEVMHNAVVICQENFANYWGQTLVNTMRALHDVRYHNNQEEEEEG